MTAAPALSAIATARSSEDSPSVAMVFGDTDGRTGAIESWNMDWRCSSGVAALAVEGSRSWRRAHSASAVRGPISSAAFSPFASSTIAMALRSDARAAS